MANLWTIEQKTDLIKFLNNFKSKPEFKFLTSLQANDVIQNVLNYVVSTYTPDQFFNNITSILPDIRNQIDIEVKKLLPPSPACPSPACPSPACPSPCSSPCSKPFSRPSSSPYSYKSRSKNLWIFISLGICSIFIIIGIILAIVNKHF